MEQPIRTAATTEPLVPVPMPNPMATPMNEGTLPRPRSVDPRFRTAAPPVVKNDLLPKPRQRPEYPALPPMGQTHPVHAPREFEKRSLSAYIIESPDVLQIEGTPDLLNPDRSVQLSGPALVGPDGTITLATLGQVYVAGKNLDEAKMEIAQVIRRWQPKLDLDEILGKLKVDIAAYNSKFYYVISDGAGYGEQVIPIPVTGNETVLDAIAKIQGLPSMASKKRIWLARATPDDLHPQILPIDWTGIAMRGSAVTNYQVFPGDRIYIQSDRLLNFNSALGKVLAPIERVLGVTLLGASTVQTIRQGNQFGGNRGF
jgi:protein involved in polysaccharide export with SLBB domain